MGQEEGKGRQAYEDSRQFDDTVGGDASQELRGDNDDVEEEREESEDEDEPFIPHASTTSHTTSPTVRQSQIWRARMGWGRRTRVSESYELLAYTKG